MQAIHRFESHRLEFLCPSAIFSTGLCDRMVKTQQRKHSTSTFTSRRLLNLIYQDVTADPMFLSQMNAVQDEKHGLRF